MTIPEAIAASDPKAALAAYDEEVSRGRDPWDIHLSLFPAVQGVLNPPFINPHLPKMHAICRDFMQRMRSEEDISALVRLEVSEHARRPNLGHLPRPSGTVSRVSFSDIEAAIAGGTPAETAGLMASFCLQHGAALFTQKMILLGSGHLESSLGHSISCTAFILLEMMERKDQDQWPVLAALADYFHKGKFNSTPPLNNDPVSEKEMNHHLIRATSGRGIINLHHTITIYAIDRVRHLFGSNDFNHLIHAWISFLGDKNEEPFPALKPTESPPSGKDFQQVFNQLDPESTMGAASGFLTSTEGRFRLSRYLIEGVCSLYQGNYNPHHLTGLGSAFWAVERHADTPVAANALYQYLDYFCLEMAG